MTASDKTADHDVGYLAAVDDVLATIREVYAKAGEPTPLHKGIRMACSSITDRVEALADETAGRKLYRQRADSLARANEAMSSRTGGTMIDAPKATTQGTISIGTRVEWVRDGRPLSGYVKCCTERRGGLVYRVESNGHIYTLEPQEIAR